jgi:geranylgeranyl diphosphate synthase type I
MTSTLESVRLDINREIEHMLEQQRPLLLEISPALGPMFSQVENLLQGGKRLRPLFGYCGLRVAGGEWSVLNAKALTSLEFLQACALIHDDVMDDSKMRRGNLAVHEYFKEMHSTQTLRGNAYLYGIGSAILLGDLCLSWADELLMKATDFSSDVKELWDITRTELMAGQYLDLFAQSSLEPDTALLDSVITYKSAKYSVERPMHLGAALVRRDPMLEQTLSAYAIPLGKAFQLRDDILGVFGDEIETGKPSGDDIREGKYTMLISLALANSSETESEKLKSLLGKQALTEPDIAVARELLQQRALPEVEALIEKLTIESQNIVDTLETDTETKELMGQLIVMATARKQ